MTTFSYEGYMGLEEHFDPSASLLEEYLESITTLPAELKRTATLLREVDAKYAHDVALLKAAQEEHLDAVGRRAPNADNLQAVVAMHKKRLDTRLEEKKALVQQLFESTQRSITRLNRDIKNFQGLLKETGDLDDTALMLAGDQPVNRPVPPPSTSKAGGATAASSPVPTTTGGGQAARKSNAPAPSRVTTPPSSAASAAASAKFPPGTMVAACTKGDSGGQDLWILARVINVSQDGNVALADAENPAEKFTLSQKHIVVLIENEDVTHARARLGTSKNRRVMALYPDTTSFYPANIAQTPFRCTDPDPALNGKVCIGCIFDDDEDATTGISPKRTVPVRYVFLLDGR